MGGITCGDGKAFAILITGYDEVAGSSPERFTYRTKVDDKGRYALTAATRESRHAIRILRSHSSRSLWSPCAGIRYDGLYRVTGWTIHPDAKLKTVVYDVGLERLPSETPMDSVLCRPFAAEIEDYREFKRLRQIAKIAATSDVEWQLVDKPTFLLTTDSLKKDSAVPVVLHA